MHHSQTQENVMTIMAVQKKAYSNMELLTREKCLEVFQAQQELQLEMIDEIMKGGMFHQPQTAEAQQEQMMKHLVMQAKSAD